MSRFSLKADPTFTASVDFPVAGAEPVPVKLTFKHRTKAQLDEWLVARAERSDIDSFMDMVVGWDLADEFNGANVALLLDNHIGVAVATWRAYIDELTAARRGN
jgi:hypothetical protein